MLIKKLLQIVHLGWSIHMISFASEEWMNWLEPNLFESYAEVNILIPNFATKLLKSSNLKEPLFPHRCVLGNKSANT